MSAAVDVLGARIAEWTGLRLDQRRRDAVARVLEQRRRALDLPTVDALVEAIQSPDDATFRAAVDAVAITYSWLFRDAEQLEGAVEALAARGGGGPLRVWIPACASGEDAYALALLCAERGLAVELFATDVCSEALRRARLGRYGRWSIRDVPPRFASAFREVAPDVWEVADALRTRVRFEWHNLLAEPPRGSWHLILCRNVLFYFEPEVARAALSRLGHAVAVDGLIVLGPSEVVHTAPEGLVLTQLRGGRAALRRPARGERVERAPGGERVGRAPGGERVERAPSAERVGRAPRAGAAASSAVAGAIPRAHAGPFDGREPDAVATLGRGHRLLAAGQLGQAAAQYRCALDEDPLNPEAHLFVGIAAHLEGGAAAVEPLERALALDPRLWPAAYYLAQAYETAGRPAEALAQYQRLLVLERVDRSLLSVGPICEELRAWRPDVFAVARRKLHPSRRAR